MIKRIIMTFLFIVTLVCNTKLTAFAETDSDISKSFADMDVKRVYGSDRYATSFAIAEAYREKLNIEKFDAVIVANGNNFADALAGSYLSAVKEAPVLMSSGKNGADIYDYVSKNLNPGGVVFILGGEGAVPEQIEDALAEFAPKRLYGKSRYETNVEIMKEAGIDDQPVLVSTGTNFADSLSASATGMPILLVGASLGTLQEEILDTYGENGIYILGGEGAVSKSIEDEISVYGETRRLSGGDRYETSIAIANEFYPEAETVVLTDGGNYPDGLCGGVLAVCNHSPLILIAEDCHMACKEYVNENAIESGTVLGGAAAVPEKVINSIFKKESIYPYVHDALSWENIEAFPIASDSMTTEELRELCVEFFRYSKLFAWTPKEDWTFVQTKKGKKDSVEKGTVYGGFPYMHKGSGNIYRMMDYYDTDTGAVDISEEIKENSRLIGSQCSFGSYWGWARVINSAQFGSTYDMVPSRGFLPLGDYEYDESVKDYREGTHTIMICNNTDEQTMYESYALLKLADGLVYYTGSSGHVIMCSQEPVVVRNDDGTIDPNKSYIKIIDQSMSWETSEQSNGDAYSIKKYIDKKYSFTDLLDRGYIPFTFAEFLGTDPVEELEFQFGHGEETISVQQLEETVLISNYDISDSYVYVKEQNGNIVHTDVNRMELQNVKSISFGDKVDGDAIYRYMNEEYYVEVVVQFVNGERRTVYSGKLAE